MTMKYDQPNRYPKESLDAAGVTSDLPPSGKKRKAGSGRRAATGRKTASEPNDEGSAKAHLDDPARIMFSEAERRGERQRLEETRACANEPA